VSKAQKDWLTRYSQKPLCREFFRSTPPRMLGKEDEV
jgi:hypothetical protein